MSSLELRATEKAKIECARKFFDALNTKNAENVTDYADLMKLVGVNA